MSKEENEIRTMLKTGASLVDYKKIDRIIEMFEDKEIEIKNREHTHQLNLRACREAKDNEILKLSKVFFSVPQPCKIVEKWNEALELKKEKK